MSVTANEIIKKLEQTAPKELCCEWDNVGIMAGDAGKTADTVLIALDCTEKVIDEAAAKGADMIITHHPFIFKPIKNLDYSSPLSRRIAKVIKNDILVYSAHTNLDIAYYGTNYTLAGLLELQNVKGLVPMGGGAYMGRIGELNKDMTFSELTTLVKNKLCAEHVTVNGDMSRSIKKVALCTGAGADYDFLLCAKKMGADAYITGDVGYHDAQNAEELDICLIDATHYLTEVIVVQTLYDLLSSAFKEVKFIKSDIMGQTLNIV